MKLVVIGGGAAGFFCAINAAKMCPSLEVLLLEKTGKLLSKVKVSGGGRCNVTHSHDQISEMAACYPRGANFVKKMFPLFFVKDTINWFNERGVALKTEEDGRMFPVTDSSQTIIDCFLQEASKYKVAVQLHTEVLKLQQEHKSWIIQTNKGMLTADFIFVATGGFSTAEKFNWLTAIGHTIQLPAPSLFTFNLPGNAISHLMGIVCSVKVGIKGTKWKEEGALLITHWGFSGPAVLRLSARAALNLQQLQYNFTITVNWLPHSNENALIAQLQQCRFTLASQKIINRNPFQLSQRLWEYHLIQCAISPECRWADLPARNQHLLAKQLTSQLFEVKGKTTFKEEFVTAGGIKTEEVNPNTMQSNIAEGLYFGGEILNVDGITGGYNFQHAWSSGWIAARAIAQNSNQRN